MPFGDVDLWEEHGLPVAGDDAYPVAIRFGPDGELDRPEAAALLRQFEDDSMALWRYGRALWTFRQEGDGLASRDRLRQALRANRRVPKYLTGEE